MLNTEGTCAWRVRSPPVLSFAGSGQAASTLPGSAVQAKLLRAANVNLGCAVRRFVTDSRKSDEQQFQIPEQNFGFAIPVVHTCVQAASQQVEAISLHGQKYKF